VKFSKDGRLIVTAGYDLLINVWDVETLNVVRSFSGGHHDWPFCCCFSNDSRLVVSGGRDNLMIVWSVETGVILKAIRWNNWIWAVGFSKDGRYFCSVGDDRELTVWNPNTFERISSVSTNAELKCLAFKPNSTSITVGGGGLFTFDLPSMKLIRKTDSHTNTIWCCDYSKDGKYLVSGSWDRTLMVYETETGKVMRTLLGHDSYVWGCSFSSAFYFDVSKRLLRLARIFCGCWQRLNLKQKLFVKLILRAPLENLLPPAKIEMIMELGLNRFKLGLQEEKYLQLLTEDH